jgi:uncharacterized protein (TIGR03437 family)
VLFSGAPELTTAPRITIGGQQASFAGNGYLVAPGLVQFNLTVPDLPDGEYVIQAQAGGLQSPNTIFLAIGR